MEDQTPNSSKISPNSTLSTSSQTDLPPNQTENPIILFDLDCTLINTATLVSSSDARLSEVMNVSVVEVVRIRKEYSSSLNSGIEFDPQKFLETCSSHSGVEMSVLEQAFYLEEAYKACVFPEVKEVLDYCANHTRIGVYTEGLPSWQKQKLVLSGLIDYFKPEFQYIVAKKTTQAVLDELPSGAVIVDDKWRIIERLCQSAQHVTPVWLIRSKTNACSETVSHAEYSEHEGYEPSVYSLKELAERYVNI